MKAATSVSQDPVRSVGVAVSPVPGVGGSQGVVDPAALAVEEIRKRVMREAEEAFAREIQKQQALAEETQSYQTASSGMDGGQTLGGHGQQYVPTGGWVWVPEGGGQPSPQQGGRPPILHRLGFSLVILWEIRQHVRSQDHR